jgi:hypothetical protein
MSHSDVEARLKNILKRHEGDIRCVQWGMHCSGDEELLYTYLDSNITNGVCVSTDGVSLDRLGIRRSTSMKASDPKFKALQCNKCHVPSDGMLVAVMHHKDCYTTCINDCGCKVTVSDMLKGSKMNKETLANLSQSMHDRECVMLCRCGVEPPHRFGLGSNADAQCKYKEALKGGSDQAFKCKHI